MLQGNLRVTVSHQCGDVINGNASLKKQACKSVPEPLGKRDSRECVRPGPITSALLRDGPQERIQETRDWIQSQVPIKRFGTPEEIAAGVLYLTSPESAFVLGAELIIDGGMATL